MTVCICCSRILSMGEIETLQQSQAVTATTLRWLPLDAPCLGSWGGVLTCVTGVARMCLVPHGIRCSLPPGFPCPPRTFFTKDLPNSVRKGFLLLCLQGTSYYVEIPSMPSHLFKNKTVFRKMRWSAFLVECSYLDSLNFKELLHIHVFRSHSSPVCAFLSVL